MIRKKTSLHFRDAILLLFLVLLTVDAFVLSPVKTTARWRPPQSSGVCRKASCFTEALPPFRTAMRPPIPLSIPFALLPALPSTQTLIAWWYLTLLAMLFATQPFFMKKYIPTTICRSTVVLAQEVAKFVAAAGLLWISGGWTSSVADWSVRSWVFAAGIPAAIFVVQNYCALMAYQSLPPITFNVLNQTKTLSAALCCYFVMNRPQSRLQVVSLMILLLAALVIEKVLPIQKRKEAITAMAVNGEKESSSDDADTHMVGVIAVLSASLLSGLAGALTQRSMETTGRNAFLFTMELSVASSFFLITSLLMNSPDGKRIAEHGFFSGWKASTWIPICTKALGGVVVGLVTKHAGAVRKGFALIFGLLLSGILQSKEEGITPEQVVGGILAALSLWMHSSFPHVAVATA